MMLDFLRPFAGYGGLIATIASVAVSTAATVHVLLYKKETRSAIGWIGLIWLSPFVGSLIYVLLGINRINRKAKKLRRDRPEIHQLEPRECTDERFDETLGDDGQYLRRLAMLVGNTTDRRLLEGNRIAPLDGGDEAYPAIVRAIDSAERSITLMTYIFRDDRAGRPVADALERALGRGVAIRVLIDAIGSVHEGSPIVGHLRRRGINVAVFMSTLRPGWIRYANLRTHRKVLVVDGRLGFTGGMNILDDFMEPEGGGKACRDVHFEVEGPILAALQQVFADDWGFTTGETFEGEPWFPLEPEPAGTALARVIADGPDLDHDPIATTKLGALSVARRSVAIVTPYFIPDNAIQSALAIAALRGVDVDIILPGENNHKVVKWAGMTLLEPLLEAGCRVWLSEPPFEHTKLTVVDGLWTLFGSANWDPRSFVLNFELDVECYDRDLAAALSELIERRRRSATSVTLDDLRGRSLPIKLRDNLARLLSPYL